MGREKRWARKGGRGEWGGGGGEEGGEEGGKGRCGPGCYRQRSGLDPSRSAQHRDATSVPRTGGVGVGRRAGHGAGTESPILGAGLTFGLKSLWAEVP